MLYSSGTTGRPKGVQVQDHTQARRRRSPLEMGMMTAVWGMDERRRLPVARAAVPLGAAVLLHEHDAPRRHRDRAWSSSIPKTRSRAIEQYHVTHSQWVPTMFVRMLKLPDDVRARSTTCRRMKVAIHAAAPCSVEVKRKMIEWWGPIIDEYYAATEGMGATFINSDRLARAPRFGRQDRCSARSTSSTTTATTSRPATSAPCGSSRRRAGPASSTTRTRQKTQRLVQRRTAGRRVGDMGYLDDDGYLYLTDRRTFMIVSGGVNIYPQEAENMLIDHPKVYDVAVFGIPDPEMGEKVHAVVQPTDVGRRRARARTRAARALPRAPRALQVPEGDRLRSASCRANRPASSTSACCATATGATRRRASS